MTTFLTLVFMAVAVLLILVVLVQRGRGGGLAGAFGSGGGSTSAFGTKTGDVFTTVTVVLFVIFMFLAIWLNLRFASMKESITGTIRPEVTNPESQPSGLVVEPGFRPPTTTTAPATVLPATTAPTPVLPPTTSAAIPGSPVGPVETPPPAPATAASQPK
jgi:preprotein translocase subunit SecG